MQKQSACQRCSSCIRLLPQLPDPVFRLLAHFRGVQLVELSFDEALQLGPVVALERAQVFKVPLGLPDLGLDPLLGAEQRVEFLPRAGECVGSLDFFVRGARIVVCDGGGPTVPQVRRAESLAEGGRGLQVIDALAAQWGSFRLPGAQAVWCDFGQPLRAPDADAWAWLRRVLAAFPLGDSVPFRPAARPALAGAR